MALASELRARAASIALGVLVAVAFAALFGETTWELVRDWAGDEEYRHGFLLLPVAAWLAWERRLRPRPTPSRGLGLALLAGAVLLFLAGVAAAEFFTRRFAILLALAGLAGYYLGARQLRAWWLPFGLLVFTIPLPEVVLNSLSLRLQLLASEAAVAALEFRHIPVALSGNVIQLPGQDLFVAEACSGLRSLSALFGLTLLFAGTGLALSGTRAVLLALAVPIALVTNAFRVFGTGYLAFYMGPRVTEGALHEAAGIAVFILALAGVGAAMLLLRKLERARAEHRGRKRRRDSAADPDATVARQPAAEGREPAGAAG